MNKAKSKKRPSLKKYIIPMEWRMRGSIEVYGYDKEDAENKIKMEVVGVPVGGVYVMGSGRMIRKKD